MSYSLTEFHFHSNMNLIVGPNGSGKSTFVCAVCIGLGGKLANLGKESMTTDGFIKDNENDGYIELELKGKEENTSVVVRTILHRKSKTEWMIDGVLVNESSMKKLMRSFNIQLDNLCQFLPQDRVSKFADLKPEELLREIEKCYKDGELLDEHLNIIQLQGNVNEQEKRVEEDKKRLEELRVKNKSLKENVEKHRHYMQLEKELKKTELIRPYIEYQDLKKQRDELKGKYDVLKNDYQLFMQKVAPIKESLQHVDDEMSSSDEAIKKLERKIKVYDDKIADIRKSINKINSEIDQNFQSIKNFEQQCEFAKNSYLDSKGQLKEWEKRLSTLENDGQDVDIGPLKTMKQNIQNEIYEIEDLIGEWRTKLNTQKRLKTDICDKITLERGKLSSKDRLVSLDRRKFGKTIDAVYKLRQYKDRLNARYYEPAILTLNVSDKHVAPIVEALIQFTHLNAIVVPSGEDYHAISRFLYDEQKIMVSIRTLGKDNQDIVNDRISDDIIKELGFDGWLTDYLRAPREVIQMLCENANIHKIPISIAGLKTEQKQKIEDSIRNGLDLVKYVSYDEIYTMNKSKYGRQQITTTIKSFRLSPQIFGIGLSEEQKGAINERIRELESRLQSINDEMVRLSESMKSDNTKANDKRRELQDVEGQIHRYNVQLKERDKIRRGVERAREQMEVKRVKYKELRKSKLEQTRGEVYDRIDGLVNERLRIMREDYRESMEKKMEADKEYIIMKVKSVEESNRVLSIKRLVDSSNEEMQRLGKLAGDAKEEVNAIRGKCKKAKLEVEEATSRLSLEEKQEVATMVQKWIDEDKLSVVQLNMRLEQLHSEMALSGGGRSSGRGVLYQLQENEEEITEIEERIPHIEALIEKVKQELDEKRTRWESQLEGLISQVQEDFSRNMAFIASAGDVQLERDDNDFKKWGVVIKVSFRDNEGLSAFNGAQHSGGEKSTTTAVFVNSLQGLTQTPFRVVDEINQGMDAINERRAHELIVQRASQIGASQYFLITPKLLTGLYYSSEMGVHCIFAGRWIPEAGNNDSNPGNAVRESDFCQLGISQMYM